jgi:hypothetical protein
VTILDIDDDIEWAVFSQRSNEPFAPDAIAAFAIAFNGIN